MNINYDPETDSLYIDFSTKPSVESEAVTDDVVVDFGENGEPVGIDIQNVGKIVDLSELVTRNFSVTKGRQLT